jgi:hypothetical protein
VSGFLTVVLRPGIGKENLDVRLMVSAVRVGLPVGWIELPIPSAPRTVLEKSCRLVEQADRLHRWVPYPNELAHRLGTAVVAKTVDGALSVVVVVVVVVADLSKSNSVTPT